MRVVEIATRQNKINYQNNIMKNRFKKKKCVQDTKQKCVTCPTLLKDYEAIMSEQCFKCITNKVKLVYEKER